MTSLASSPISSLRDDEKEECVNGGVISTSLPTTVTTTEDTKCEKMDDTSPSFVSRLAYRFLGDFDNYIQVQEDRQNGLLPREGGGHEHMHATFVPLGIQLSQALFGIEDGEEERESLQHVRMAAYYLDGTPQKLFRLRVYTMEQETKRQEEDEGEDSVRMKLYSLRPDLLGSLSPLLDHPELWESTLLDAIDREEGTSSVTEGGLERQPFVVEMTKCDVLWSEKCDPQRHTYLLAETSNTPSPPEEAYHALMANGEAIIDSTMKPGSKIRVIDELSLWQQELWINDRGFDVITGEFLYGNQLGIPYKVQRVAELVGVSQEEVTTTMTTSTRWERKVVCDDLAWTLGDKWRTEQEYEEKMDALQVPTTSSVDGEGVDDE